MQIWSNRRGRGRKKGRRALRWAVPWLRSWCACRGNNLKQRFRRNNHYYIWISGKLNPYNNKIHSIFKSSTRRSYNSPKKKRTSSITSSPTATPTTPPSLPPTTSVSKSRPSVFWVRRGSSFAIFSGQRAAFSRMTAPAAIHIPILMRYTSPPGSPKGDSGEGYCVGMKTK